MSDNELQQLSETAQLLLGAYAMADLHTLAAADVVALSNGVITAERAGSALGELTLAGFAQVQDEAGATEYRLTRRGIEVTLQMQQALAQRSGKR